MRYNKNPSKKEGLSYAIVLVVIIAVIGLAAFFYIQQIRKVQIESLQSKIKSSSSTSSVNIKKLQTEKEFLNKQPNDFDKELEELNKDSLKDSFKSI